MCSVDHSAGSEKIKVGSGKYRLNLEASKILIKSKFIDYYYYYFDKRDKSF